MLQKLKVKLFRPRKLTALDKKRRRLREIFGSRGRQLFLRTLLGVAKPISLLSEAQFHAWVTQVTGLKAPGRHYWKDSQYRFPTAVNYAALQTGGFFRREYEDLRREYEDLRRPWNFAAGSEEILRFSGVQGVRKIHPTQKPTELLSYLIERSSNPGALVLDPFAGSGSTLKAAQLTGRRALGIEMDEEYCRRAQAWLDSAELPPKRVRKSRADNLSTDGEQLLLGLF